MKPTIQMPSHSENASEKPSRFAWTNDLFASVVVFFVALPLCMGIALASGAPVAAGLITGIVGGLVAGSLAGCPLQVSGPAAGLTVIVFELVRDLGLQTLGLAVLVAGGFQIAAGFFKLGQWFRAVSPAVIQGMLAGIGVLIFASQFHVMVDDKPRHSGLENLLSIPEAISKAVGMPRLHSEQERTFRTEALQKLADIHHHQIQLQTHVADLTPYHDKAHAAPELQNVVSPDLADFSEKQREITQDIAALCARVDEIDAGPDDNVHLDRGRDALTQAKAASEKAESSLQAGFAIQACETQAASVAALDRAAARLKNHRIAASLGILTIVVIVLWARFAPRSIRLIPGPLIAVSLATTLAALFTLPVIYVEVPGSLLEEMHFPTWTLIQNAPWAEILQAGMLIALVASAETLLCAAAVDKLTTESRTDYDRELIAQGAGNAVCGMLGALPMTGVIVRSSANLQAGAKTRLSAVLHGVWLLLFVVALSGVLNLIPTASLAAVLVYTGYKLVNFKAMKALLQYGRGELGIYLATMVTIVVEDLLIGVMLGVAMASLKLLYTFSNLKIIVENDGRDGRTTLRLHGAATFLRLPKLAAVLDSLPEDAHLHVDLERLSYIDHACLDLFTTWASRHEAAGGQLIVDWDSLHQSFWRQRAPEVRAPDPAPDFRPAKRQPVNA